jgi:phosphoribosyl 1,2-cyclic phosphodiesterase
MLHDPASTGWSVMSDIFQVKLWGTRGSLPVSGPAHAKYGGNTICIEMRCGDHVLLFDAGSGLLPAGAALAAEGQTGLTLYFTHCHYDHIVGLPFFLPLYYDQFALKVWTGHLGGTMTTHDMIAAYMRPPFFPIGPEYCRACLNTGEFAPGDVLSPHPGITVRTGLLNHPGRAVGYRVEWAGRAVAVITDTEHDPGTLDPAVLDLIGDCDLFLYDATYTDTEFATFRGFGHSTWQQGVRLAQASGAKSVGFIHHAKRRTDSELNAIERHARRQFAGAFCGRDLQVIDITA